MACFSATLEITAVGDINCIRKMPSSLVSFRYKEVRSNIRQTRIEEGDWLV